MKKTFNLLSLTITILTTSTPAPLLANTTLIRDKRDIRVYNPNKDYLPIKEIKIGGSYIKSIAVDSKNNIYFGTTIGAYKLSVRETTPVKIDSINEEISSIVIDNKNHVYFDGNNSVKSITAILYWVKQQSKFALVDSSKTKTWTRPDLITVYGELNISIANPNIDKILFDNVQQKQTNKQWKINVKPETSEKDHKLQVFFTLDGKQYTSEIIVSRQAKIDLPRSSIKENPDKVIKFGNDNNLENIIDNNHSTIIAEISQINARQVDFSQIEFEEKNINSITLKAKKDSKSYTGSVSVTYNVVPSTVSDLKIDLQPTSLSQAIVTKDYVGQIDTSNITNPVNTFYYANSESKIKMIKPTENSVITGVVCGYDDIWNKTSQQSTIDPTNGIVLDSPQLDTINGKYVVELSDNLDNTNNIYL